ncbi:MAG TPA: thioesterase family protein [Pyrinomonadaceae bacterium]|nr:thioesterase family protein [Pyrinomonadaceae bacterium]
MVFSTTITVRFADCDPVGFVYYPRVLHYCHVCMEEFFAARCGITYQKLLDDERLGFATVKIEAEYFVPLVYGDKAVVELEITDLGRSSARFNYSVKRADDDVLCAQSSQVQVAMDIDKRKAVPLPEKYRVAFSS